MRRRGVGALRRAGFRGKGARDPILLNLGPSGPGTFARASAAWRSSDNDLLVQAYGSGALRRYNQDGHWWNVLEGAIENLCGADPVDITIGSSNWGALGSGTSDDDVAVAPDGTTTASRLTFTAAAADGAIGSGGTTPGSSALVRVSLWARTESGTQTFRIAIFDGVSYKSSGDLTATTTWQRFSAAVTVDATPTAGSFAIRNGTGASAGSLLVWGADLQEDAPNLLVSPVLAATSTKAADDLSVAAASVPEDIRTVGFWWKYKPYHSSTQWIAENISSFFLWFSNNNRLSMNNGAGTFSYRANGGGSITSTNKTWSARQELTFVVDHVAQEIRFGGFTTGDEDMDISAAVDWDSASANDLQICNLSALTNPAYGEMSDIYPLATAPI